MSSIKTATEILTNPIKIQEIKVNELLIKELKNKWKNTLISFISGVIIALGTVLLSSMLSETGKPLNGELLLNTVTKQAETIHTLTIENTNLKLTLKKVESSSEIKN
ncbi:hypothetical protein [Polaribacter sp. SA4-12]|uniref:hypothetical protein n=1 Tax=Polaribacter sp. SA4-12 TaxID=1312072 RepID=UPI000B3CE32B|nr:hypothetical protein [Polaribacter sp. SA4-12]ARV14013.1 hypothetical protein BTO07_02110 [Polaribacter sp. SA4-12]